MDADGVDVFHRTNGNDVPLFIAHGLKLNLLPPGDTFLHEYLRDGGKVQARFCDQTQFFLRFGDPTARAAERIRRANDDRIPYLLCRVQGFFYRDRNFRRDYGLSDLFHFVAEQFSVFRRFDRVDVRTEQSDVVFLQRPFFVQLHSDRETRLSPQPGKQTVWTFFLNNAFHRLRVERFEIHFVRHHFVRHDGRGIGIDENGVNPFLLQNTARLRSGVVKLRRLSDDDGTRTDDKHFLYVFIFRHSLSPPS